MEPIPSFPTRYVYRRILQRLQAARVPFLVGGSFALARYTGIARHSKDFDLFVRPEDLALVEQALAGDSRCVLDRFAPHWLWKIHRDGEVVDLIFSSGNGMARVDEAWFEHATQDEIFGSPVLLCPPEEIIWSKAFIMERERFDGADVAHLLHERAESLDWERLLERFGDHWRVLLAHLVLFGYVYPGRRDAVPSWVLDGLLRRLAGERDAGPPAIRTCLGTLLSRCQYLVDVEDWGYRDGRLLPAGPLDRRQVEEWTDRMEEDGIAAPQPDRAIDRK